MEEKLEKKTTSKKNVKSVDIVEPKIVEEKYKKGHVVRCKVLNVRDNPSLSSEIISQLLPVDEVKVNITKSTATFYCINLGTKIGYSLKEYIELEV